MGRARGHGEVPRHRARHAVARLLPAGMNCGRPSWMSAHWQLPPCRRGGAVRASLLAVARLSYTPPVSVACSALAAKAPPGYPRSPLAPPPRCSSPRVAGDPVVRVDARHIERAVRSLLMYRKVVCFLRARTRNRRRVPAWRLESTCSPTSRHVRLSELPVFHLTAVEIRALASSDLGEPDLLAGPFVR